MKKWILIAAVALIILAPIGAIGVLLYTETGVDIIGRQLHRLERFGVRIEGLSGTLSGPLRVARFELNHPRVHIVSHSIVIQPRLRGLLLQTVSISSLTALDTLVEIRRPPELPIIDRPPRFLPSFLRVSASDVEFTRIHYVNINGMTVDINRLHGHARISPRDLRVPEFHIDADQFAAQGNTHLKAQRPLALELNTTGTLRTPRGIDLLLAGQLSGTIEVLGIKATMQQPSVASAEGTLTRPENRWRIDGRVTSPDFSFAPWLEKPPFTLRDVALDVQVEPEEIQVAGLLGIPEYQLLGLTMNARGRFANRTLHLNAADFGLADAPGQLHMAGNMVFDGAAPTLDLSGHWRELQWPLRADAIVNSIAGELALSGPLPYQFSMQGDVSSPRFPTMKGVAHGVISKEQLTLAEYQFDALTGSIAGAGSLQIALPRAWTLSMRSNHLDTAQLHEEFPGVVNFVADGRGEGLNKQARFDVSFKNLNGTLRGERVRGSGAIARNATGWRVRDVSVQLGGSQLTLDGSLTDTVDARWSLQSRSLSELLPEARGSLNFSGSASGALKAPHVIATLQGDNLRYQNWRVDQLAIQGDIDMAGGAPSSLTLSAQRAGRGTPMADSVRVSARGTPLEHEIGIDVVGIAEEGEGVPQVNIDATGRLENGVWKARLMTTHLSDGESQEVEIVEPANILLSRERAELDNLCLALGAGRFCANGKWQRNGPWEGTVAGYELPLAALLPQSAEDAEYIGRIEGRVHASGAPGQTWRGDAGMRIIDAGIVYSPPGAEPETLNLGTGGLAATATAEQIEFSFGVQAFTDTFIYANAHLDRDGSTLMRLPLRGDVRARAGDANILPLVFPEIDHAAGVLTANAAITGTLAAPQISGRVELANGEFDSYRVNLALRELSVIVDVATNALTFKGSGRAGDGQLNADGRFAWSGGESKGRLHLKGLDLLVADLPEYRVVASPDFEFAVDGNHIEVVGDVAIPSARIQPRELSGVVRASDDARFVDEHSAEREGRLTVHSQIAVAMGEDVRIDAFGLQGRIDGAVGVTSTTGEATIGRGELSVVEGRYEAYGQKLEINRGRLLFEASVLDDPALDIEARRKVETVEVGLNVRGTLRSPRLTFFSDPSMPQSQIVSYLLVGKPMDQIRSADRTTVQSAGDALAFQGGGLLASQLGRRLGIDAVGVESNIGAAGDTNPSLVLGKFLSPRLFVSYGISLTESINTLKLRYTISDKWILKTESGAGQSADVEFTVER